MSTICDFFKVTIASQFVNCMLPKTLPEVIHNHHFLRQIEFSFLEQNLTSDFRRIRSSKATLQYNASI